MSISETVALDYAQRMFERQRTPLPPLGFQVDWADQPSRHKLYLDTVKLPLPAPFGAMPSVPVGEAASGARKPWDDSMPGLDVLASALACYGLVDRRISPNWNEDSRHKLKPAGAVWARPTASGGGMYPAESYLVAGSGAPLPVGVYHYDSAHHSLDRLSVADRAPDVVDATGVGANLYLVSTLRFWKNAFKYNSFCYHVVTQDAGALLGSWRTVLAASGNVIEPVLWFDDSAVAAALDVDGRTEAPFVVVPLGPRHAGASRPENAPGSAPLVPRRGGVEEHRVWERSHRVRDFELVERVHAAALVGDGKRPPATASAVGEPEPVTGEVTTLPPPEALPRDLDLTGSLLTRRSSFGQLTSRPPLSPADLGWVLSTVDAAAHAGADVAPAPRSRWTRLWVLANSVDGLEQRAYAYERHRLVGRAPIDFATLQRYYALTNYNMREVAAVLVITGRLPALVAAYGARGYRMLGIEVGQAAQLAYLAATARRLGIGAVLGVDNLAVDELLGIDGSDERSMLFILLGHERPDGPNYDHSLLRRTNGATDPGAPPSPSDMPVR